MPVRRKLLGGRVAAGGSSITTPISAQTVQLMRTGAGGPAISGISSASSSSTPAAPHRGQWNVIEPGFPVHRREKAHHNEIAGGVGLGP